MAHETKFYQGGGEVLLLTLALEAESLSFFEAERQRYYPEALNIAPAHLILIHKLPGVNVAQIRDALSREAAGCENVVLRIAGLRSLGRGVAYKVECDELIRLRARLAGAFDEWLTPQDRQGYRPHVTIQNKVSAQEARRTLADLQQAFVPFEAVGTGVLLWRYLNGPWEFVDRFPFADGHGIRHVAPSEKG